ncbi:MAG: winged helix-turn-helix transcriptional regulator [Alphaproteobacteria bacterium]|nr:winged helix-turn-helix transcriptional regulator [Alphaproteobacteria bacterium]
MNTETKLWIERLSSLQHSLMRKAAGTQGLQLVHFEILHYLSLCNRYSNTAQALSEYLGQTKGSISQSLKFLEDQAYIIRQPDTRDRRYVRLFLTDKGQETFTQMAAAGLVPALPDDPALNHALKNALGTWQRENGIKSFGQCRSCKYNQNPGEGVFYCALLKESLSAQDTEKICREHVFPA